VRGNAQDGQQKHRVIERVHANIRVMATSRRIQSRKVPSTKKYTAGHECNSGRPVSLSSTTAGDLEGESGAAAAFIFQAKPGWQTTGTLPARPPAVRGKTPARCR